MSKKVLDRSWRRKDFRVDYFRGSGKGGQNRNKRDTACRITDIETGLASTAETHRTQGQNEREAFHKLAKQLMEHHYPKIDKERAPNTERIRTYHAERGTIKDHRTGKVYDFDDVVYGNGFEKMNRDSVMLGAGTQFDESEEKE